MSLIKNTDLFDSLITNSKNRVDVFLENNSDDHQTSLTNEIIGYYNSDGYFHHLNDLIIQLEIEKDDWVH